MKTENKIRISLVDDDAMFLKLLEIEFRQSAGFTIETFATGELFMENIPLNTDVIILDYQLDSVDKNAMNGMETLDKIKAINPHIPVVILSSQDKMKVAINCIQHGALDYVVKSENAFRQLKQIVNVILHHKTRIRFAN